MTLCINPSCRNPKNPDNNLFCHACGSELLLVGRYQVMRLLSDKGGFRKTYEVTHNNTTKILKILTNQDPEALRLFEKEFQILSQLKHPGIPQGEEYFTFFPRYSQVPLHCLVMQYIGGMDLEEYQKNRDLRPIDQKLAVEWLHQLALILDAIHKAQFFHRDIKPSNIILKPDGQLVLIDFGVARQVMTAIQASSHEASISTAGYLPPEQKNGCAVPRSDFFALGRTFVYLLTGKHPTEPDIYDPNTDELSWRKFASRLDSKFADFIDKLMERSASKRPVNTRAVLKTLNRIQNRLYPSSKLITVSQTSDREDILPSLSINYRFHRPLKLSSRREFLKIAGLTSGGVVTAIIAHKLLNRSSLTPISPAPEPEPQLISHPSAHPLYCLYAWSFEVVTVNSRGEETKREQRQGRYYRENLRNEVFLDMVSIPGGSFMMGSPESEKERWYNEGPQHQRAIAPFFMGQYLITQIQWKAVAALPQIERFLEPEPSEFKGDNLPVEHVSWHEAVEFCQRLSSKTGRNYRLPSEAEWEYACRAGKTTPFHFGQTITADLANYDGSTYAEEPTGENRQQTTPVGSFGVANAFGLYDMHGNVWEWCADPWHATYEGAPSDGRVWESGGNKSRRLHRGGSWNLWPRLCRSAVRNWLEPGNSYNGIGFRVVVS